MSESVRTVRERAQPDLEPSAISAVRSSGTEQDQRATLIAQEWLGKLSSALQAQELGQLSELFVADCWWRDVLTFTWDLRSVNGIDNVEAMLRDSLPAMEISELRLLASPAPQFVSRTADYDDVVAAFEFESAIATGRGLARLIPDGAEWKAWVVVTEMRDLFGHEEQRTTLDEAVEDLYLVAKPGRLTATEQREARTEFRESDPDVLVIGAGHSGLMLAATLEHVGLSALVVDREERLGDNWRKRYNALTLHDTMWKNTFAYLPFPDNYPVFLPKDVVADWHETYAQALGLRTWMKSDVASATYDAEERRWTVTVVRDGVKRTLRPAHLVFATGNSGTPLKPTVPGEQQFLGQIAHSGTHQGGPALAGKRVVVVGSATSAHDIAQDAYEMGAASVTMVQRGPTYVVSARQSVGVLSPIPNEKSNIAEADLFALGALPAITTELTSATVKRAEDMDRELREGLTKAGFKIEMGRGGGHAEISLRRVGGYYIDKGCCQLIIDGQVRIQSGTIAEFTPNGVVYEDGTAEDADVVVFCTGFVNMRDAVRPICGNEVTDALEPIWGFDEFGEIRGLYRQVQHPHLWFAAGAFGHGRRHSKHLALQILAIQEGLLTVNPRTGAAAN